MIYVLVRTSARSRNPGRVPDFLARGWVAKNQPGGGSELKISSFIAFLDQFLRQS